MGGRIKPYVNLNEIFAKQLGLKRVKMPAESPQSNGMAESFVKVFKRDYARLANRPDLQTVMHDLKLWFEHFNEKHLHCALGYLPPRRFREKLRSLTNTDGPVTRGRVHDTSREVW